MDLILDASAILSGRLSSIPVGFGSVYITSLVAGEINKGRPYRILEHLLEIGLKVRDPGDIGPAINASSKTGDLDRLSNADISLIALAIELDDATVMTDDFRVQNVLSSVDIQFLPAGEIGDRKVREIWEWTFRCRGCGRYFDEDPGPNCHICGSMIGKTRKRSM